MSQTNGADIDRVVHGLHLELSSIESRLADKDAQTRMMLQTIGKFISDKLKPLQKQIEELKAQVEELKKRGVSYKGIYQKSCGYAIGDLVSYDHSVWCCIQVAQAGASPGAFPSLWQMALRGDGRDTQRQPTRGGAHRETTVSARTP